MTIFHCPPPSALSTEEVEASELEPRLVYCYPVRLAVSAPPMPSVEMHIENSVVCIRYKGEMVKVSRSYFSKLVRTVEVPVDGTERRNGIFLDQSPHQVASDKVMKSPLNPSLPSFLPSSPVAPLPL